MNRDGILLIDKPSGITSRQVVSRIKSLTRVKKAGHTGTLDPMATGLLLVCLGRATLLSRILNEGVKRYRVEALLGVETDTYDTDGEIVHKSFTANISNAALIESINSFTGAVMQIPPIYSAVKLHGKPLYEYARKGIKVDPDPRKVIIESIELISIDQREDNTRMELEVLCSPGTYIRSLVYDIGKSLGCGACVSKLRRLQSGNFSIEDGVELESLLSRQINVDDVIVSMEKASSHLPTIEVSTEGERGVHCGKPIERDWVTRGELNIKPGQIIRIIGEEGNVLAIYRGADTAEEDFIAKAVRVISIEGNEVKKDEVA